MRWFDSFAHRVAAPEPTDPLDAALAHEILESERLRSRLLAGILGFIVAMILLVIVIAPQLVVSLFGNAWWAPPVLLSAMFVYEIAGQRIVRRFIALHLLIPEPARYLNAFLETSLPTLGLFFIARAMPLEDTLNSPPAQLYYFFILLSVLRLDPRLSLFTGLVAGLEYFAFGVVNGWDTLFLQSQGISVLALSTYRAVFFAITGLLVAFVSRQVRQQMRKTLQTIQERDRATDLFGRHVSPAVAEKLLAQGAEGESETRPVCVMFLDIRDFTAYSEKTPPAEVVDYLNTLFTFMIDCVNQHQGVVNKFLGDGFMAVFGAPLDDEQHIQHAVAAARQILAQVEQVNATGTIRPTRVGIGLHAGEAVTGSVGSAYRKEYTVIGDVVNLASRIEQLNKPFGSQLLVSEAVWQGLGETAPAQVHEAVTIKGHSEPVRVYQLA